MTLHRRWSETVPRSPVPGNGVFAERATARPGSSDAGETADHGAAFPGRRLRNRIHHVRPHKFK